MFDSDKYGKKEKQGLITIPAEIKNVKLKISIVTNFLEYSVPALVTRE